MQMRTLEPEDGDGDVLTDDEDSFGGRSEST